MRKHMYDAGWWFQLFALGNTDFNPIIMNILRRFPWMGAIGLLSFVATGASAQNTRAQAQLTGTVVDAATGMPLANANVRIAGTKYAAISDASGHFALMDVPAGTYTVEGQRRGYGVGVAQRVVVGTSGAPELRLLLPLPTNRLAGLAQAGRLAPVSERLNSTGAESVLSAEMPVPANLSAVATLEGKVAGLAMRQADGSPSADLSFALRTRTSLRDSAGPLLVVDGVMLSAEYPQSYLDIDARDVARIEVLKGVAASALYGARGVNGVIVISTVRGYAVPLGRTRFSVRNEIGIESSTGFPELATAHQYRVNASGQYVNAAGIVVSRNERVAQPNGILENRYIVPTYNHGDQLSRAGLSNAQSITLQQNRAATTLNVGYTRNRTPGTVRNADGLLRQSLRVNVDQRWRDRVRAGLSASYTMGSEGPFVGSYSDVLRFDPDINLRAVEPGNSALYQLNPDNADSTLRNPLAVQQRADAQNRRQRTLVNLNVSVRALSWLSINVAGSYDRGFQDRRQLSRSGGSPGDANPFSETTTFVTDSVANGQLRGGVSAHRSAGALNAHFSLAAETQRESFQHNTLLSSRTAGAGSTDTSKGFSSTHTQNERRYTAALSELAADYAGRYVVDVAIRREGSSRYSLSKQWTSFARGSAAWILSEEPWLPFKRMNLVKLHYAVGSAELPIDEIVFVAPGFPGVPNASRASRTVTERELGLDVAFTPRVQLSATYAMSRSHERGALPNGPSINNPGFLPGALKGQTMEARLGAQLLRDARGLQWDIAVVGDHRESKVLSRESACFLDALQNLCTGNTVTGIWGLKLVREKSQLRAEHANSSGAFDINDEGFVVPVGSGNSWRDGKAKSLWGTTVRIDGRDYPWGLPIVQRNAGGGLVLTKIGDGNPALRYGLQNTVRYKSVRLYAQLAGQVGGEVYNDGKRLAYGSARDQDADQSAKPDELRKPVGYYGVLSGARAGYVDHFVGDASYLRLSEASLGITFNSNRFGFIRQLGAQRVDLELVGRNLMTFTGYSGLNPQSLAFMPTQDGLRYPLTRTFTLATSIVF